MELEKARKDLRRARRSWVPSLSANVELSMSGTSFPLTQPGFAVGVDLDFALPVVPIQTQATAGKQSPLERSAGFTFSSQPGDNLEDLYSAKVARLNVHRTRAGIEDVETDLRFAIREAVKSIEGQRRALALLREKSAIEERRRQIQELELEVGEITRLDLLRAEVDRAQLEIDIIEGVVALFNQEIALVRTAGLRVDSPWELLATGSAEESSP